jgi:hypothetical protein
MHKSKHSKFKNTGILFELLTRQLTADILVGETDSKSKELLFKYFKESRELGKEWQLYNFLVNEQFLDDKKAERALGVVLKAREKLDNDVLNEEKYSLIKEIKEIYPIENFLKSSIKNYKVYASIYKVFESHVGKVGFELSETIQAKDCLIENLVKIKNNSTKTKEDTLIEEYKKQTEDVRLLAYKFLVENLNKKYKSLDIEQKNILKEYINNISNTNSLAAFIIQQRDIVRNGLNSLLEKIDSQVAKIKVSEVINQLNNINVSRGVKDSNVMVLLLSYELIKEIKNNLQ